MTVYEYREKNPNCRYCKYGKEVDLAYYCEAKQKFVFFNKAKKCEVYQARGEDNDRQRQVDRVDNRILWC